MAKAAGVSGQQLRSDYETALAEHPAGLRSVEVSYGDESRDGDCVK